MGYLFCYVFFYVSAWSWEGKDRSNGWALLSWIKPGRISGAAGHKDTGGWLEFFSFSSCPLGRYSILIHIWCACAEARHRGSCFGDGSFLLTFAWRYQTFFLGFGFFTLENGRVFRVEMTQAGRKRRNSRHHLPGPRWKKKKPELFLAAKQTPARNEDTLALGVGA